MLAAYRSRQSSNARLVPCFPLHALLVALNQTTVDFLSLDVEGFELEVSYRTNNVDLSLQTAVILPMARVAYWLHVLGIPGFPSRKQHNFPLTWKNNVSQHTHTNLNKCIRLHHF